MDLKVHPTGRGSRRSRSCVPGVEIDSAGSWPVLETLISAMAQHEATCLVTGDKGLLDPADRYPIVTPSRFWARHGPV